MKASIKMDLKEVGWGDMDWINLAQDRDRWLARIWYCIFRFHKMPGIS